ncbi:MAG: DUF2723 domain-containing protein, partial [Holophagales bacterium]|nr:DUF2723 domain-containing protein [Holophagales bacterium]
MTAEPRSRASRRPDSGAEPIPARGTDAETFRPGRPDLWIGVGLGGLSIGVYLLGACPTIFVGDSGELVAAAATLGIPHPSGYPLYVLLGNLWIQVMPLGSVAWRMSVFSAVFAAAAVMMLYACGRELRLGRWPSTLAALGLAFAPSFWSQANVQRVYSLSAFFLIAVTFLALRWWRTREIRWMAWAALAAGLGASNHTFLGIFGVAVGLFAVVSEPSLLRRPLDLLRCVGAGILGLLPYAYMPIRSRQQPRLDWGNPETLEGLWAAATRQGFWERRWMESAADWLPIARDYLVGLGRESLGLGLALAVAGIWLGRRRYPVLLPLLGMSANLLTQGLHGSRSDIFIWHRYYIPSHALLFLLAAIGLHLLLGRPGRAERRIGTVSRWHPTVSVTAALAVPAVLLATGWRAHDRSSFRLAEDFSRSLLDTLPPGAPLAASDDNVLFVLIYLQLVEGLRPDVHLILQGVGDADLPTLRFDPDEDPLFFTHHPNWNHPQIGLEPWGLVFRTVRRGTSPSPLPQVPPKLAGEDDPRVPKDYLTANLIGHFRAMLGMSYEERSWPRARREFVLATEAAPENDVLFYNLGLIYRRNGMPRRALEMFERSVEINPRRLAADKPARASDRVAELLPEVERLERLEAGLSGRQPLSGLAPGSAPWLRALAVELRRQG